MQSFYVREGELFLPTELTRGPWSAEAQHGGPPAALLGTLLHRLAPAWQPMRITFELFKPVPLAPLTATAGVLRQGRNAAWLAGSLFANGQEILRAQGLWLRRAPARPIASTLIAPLPGPSSGADAGFFPVPWSVGYHTGMEVRFLHGSFRRQGPGAAWMRMNAPLVLGEPVEPLARVLIAVDSTNGVSNVLDFQKWWFTNPDLTVHLHRLPAGEWVCLDARTTIEGEGVGLAESVVHDEHGACARGLQSLLVMERA